MKPKILVLCTGNSCRSQIAEAYLRHFSAGKAAVYSAGIATHGVNSDAVKIMQADGIDISNHTSNHVDEYQDFAFDFVITVCDHAKEKCPFFPSNAQKFHQNFTDPTKVKGTEATRMEVFRKVRDEIKEYCRKFTQDYLNAEA